VRRAAASPTRGVPLKQSNTDMPLCCSAATDVVEQNGRLAAGSSDEDLLRLDDVCDETPFVPLRGRIVDRALRQRGTLTRPAKEQNADHTECDPLNAEEQAMADAVTAKLSDEGRKLIEAEAGSHALVRAVRGYWTYDDRVTEATRSLEVFVELRRKYGLDDLARGDYEATKEAQKLLRQWRSMRFAGFDIYGHPVVVELVGKSLKALDWKDWDKDEIIRGRIVCTEVFQALKYAASRYHCPTDPNRVKVLKHVYVVDMKNVKTWHVTSRCRDRFKAIMKTCEEGYPEVAWRTYVVNAPNYLTIIWVVIKSWLDPVTTARVAILGTNPLKNRERLLVDNIPLDAIPQCCGGDARDVPLSLILGAADSSSVSMMSEILTPAEPRRSVAKEAPAAEAESPRLKILAGVAVVVAFGGAAVLCA